MIRKVGHLYKRGGSVYLLGYISGGDVATGAVTFIQMSGRGVSWNGGHEVRDRRSISDDEWYIMTSGEAFEYIGEMPKINPEIFDKE